MLTIDFSAVDHKNYSAKERAYLALPLTILVALFFLSIGKTVDDLRRSLTKAFVQRERVLEAWKTPRSGELEALPGNVNDALSLLRERNVTTYRLSKGWGAGDFPSQRLIEGAFPIRPVLEGASAFVGIKSDTLPSNCRVLAERGEVFLADCP